MDVTGYKFGLFRLDIRTKTLSRDNVVLPVSERQFKLLKLLCEVSPEPLSKKQLTEMLWDDVVVSDWSLFRLISDTRQLLGDNGDSQQIIHTAHGIGFWMSKPEVISLSEQDNQASHQNVQHAKGLYWVGAAAIIIAIVAVILWPVYQHQQMQAAIARIAVYQSNTFTSFNAQVLRRNELAEMLQHRLGVARNMQFEKFFSHYYSEMNQQELFVFNQIRAITETGLYQNNQAIVNELNEYPDILEAIPLTHELQQHLTFWLNKYHSVFTQRPDMCLLYVGVEDGVPYPSGVDQNVKTWLDNHP
ncbi:winged helix-turn-helix domain-containing protein [Aestuariibacter sp. GS-14]|uniref:winged helix-turn-helix domain-containing protein n=1 Tax=Aestuariibacter sp. GS-14 TaxID=2590670 RepID=UPI002103F39B|nr:winged helix-turn-helix domain-containing protein [Aestuariibacter sp. GS-14]